VSYVIAAYGVTALTLVAYLVRLEGRRRALLRDLGGSGGARGANDG